jgi:uncharacterized protein (TIGR02271 family)
MREPISGTAGMNEAEPDPLVIPIAEEEARIAKRQVVSGRVLVKTTVDTEECVLTEVLSQETVEVERIPVNRVDTRPQIRTDSDVVIVPMFAERLVVEKQLVLVEEVRIRRTASVASVEVPVTLRKERHRRASRWLRRAGRGVS